MGEDRGSYPVDLVGDDAPPPSDPSPRILAMAREAARRDAPGIEDDLPVYGAGEWRMAASLVILGDEANHANPTRDKSSDGTIGDARHQALPPGSTDHVPWLQHRGMGICRARDIDASDLPLAAAVERARVAAYSDAGHPLRGGGYIIFAGKITKPDFTGWARYLGSNPHVLMAHFSVSTDPARFDSREPWGIFREERPAPPPRRTPAPPPAKREEPADVRWLQRGPGHYRPGDPRYQATRNLQRRLKTRFPAYARHLVVDGVYGPATEAAVSEFQRRKHLEPTGVAGPLTLSRLGL